VRELTLQPPRMLRAGLANREQLPVPYYSVYSNQNDDEETFGLNGGKEKGLHWIVGFSF
jgi:hypothetical protein